jgi:arsenate reductase
MVKVYGIPNCDTVKKSTTWLKNNDIAFEFHNYKTDGVEDAKLKEWLKEVPLDKLLNKKSTTWKALTLEEQAKADVKSSAIKLMRNHTSLIKRPLVEWQDGSRTVGFEESVFSQKAKS